MSKTLMISMLASGTLLLGACGANESSGQEVSFDIRNAEGDVVGKIELESNAVGGTKIEVDLDGISDGAGSHAMHFHETGLCEAPGFTSSGGHYNPEGVSHGNVENGPHAGDMMNIEVDATGSGKFEVTNDRVSISGQGGKPPLMDADGSALVIHARGDDYESQPSGAAGPRIACAVIPAG